MPRNKDIAAQFGLDFRTHSNVTLASSSATQVPVGYSVNGADIPFAVFPVQINAAPGVTITSWSYTLDAGKMPLVTVVTSDASTCDYNIIVAYKR